MKSNTTTGRIFGSFFLLAFLTYGIGFSLIDAITTLPNSLTLVHENQSIIVVGGILMAVLHTIASLGLAVTVLPLLKQRNQSIAYGYFGAVIFSTLLLIIGAIFLLLILPLSDVSVAADASKASDFEGIASSLKAGNFFAYQLAMTIWGMGGLLFCYSLGKLKSIPRVFVVWGQIGYLFFIAGTLSELFGIKIGVVLSIPGGLFEFSLGLWLIVKGFKQPIDAVTA